MTSGPGARHGRDDAEDGDGARHGAGGRPSADGSLAGFVGRHDARLQQRALVVGHVYGVDAHEIFALTRAGLWLRWDDFGAAGEDDRLGVLWLLLARHARTLARAAGPVTAPLGHSHSDATALEAVRNLAPAWRPVDTLAVLGGPATTVFRATAHLSEPRRDVLVLFWLGVHADDVADELRMTPSTLGTVMLEAKAQLRHVMSASGTSR